MITALTRTAAALALIALALAAAPHLAGEATVAKAGVARSTAPAITLRQFEARWSGSGASARGDVAMSSGRVDVATR